MKFLLLSAVLLGLSSQMFAQTKLKKTTTFEVDEEKTKEAREDRLEQLEDARKEQFKIEEKQLEEAQDEQEETLEDFQKKQKINLEQNQKDLTKVQREEEAQKQVKEVRGTFKVKTEKSE